MSDRLRALVFLGAAAVAVLFLTREEGRGTLAPAHRTFVDWLVGNSREKIREPSVTFLRIDDADSQVFETWPLGAIDYAVLFSRLQNFSPKVVAVEPVLDWENPEELLLNSLRDNALKIRPLLVGALLDNSAGSVAVNESVLDLFPAFTRVGGDQSAIPRFTGVRRLPERRLRITSELGFTAIDLGDDVLDNVLSVPLLARHDERVVPSFVLHAVMLETDTPADQVVIELGREIRIGEDLRIPIDRRGHLAVYTQLRPRLPRHNADILVQELPEGGESGEGLLKPEERRALESRIVLLGIDDKDSRLLPLPDGEKISRGELFALAIATIQTGRYIHRISAVWEYGVWGATALFGVFALRRGRGGVFFWTLIGVVAVFAGNMLCFQTNQLWTSFVYPLAIFGACLLVGMLPRRIATIDPPETAEP